MGDCSAAWLGQVRSWQAQTGLHGPQPPRSPVSTVGRGAGLAGHHSPDEGHNG